MLGVVEDEGGGGVDRHRPRVRRGVRLLAGVDLEGGEALHLRLGVVARLVPLRQSPLPDRDGRAPAHARCGGLTIVPSPLFPFARCGRDGGLRGQIRPLSGPPPGPPGPLPGGNGPLSASAGRPGRAAAGVQAGDRGRFPAGVPAARGRVPGAQGGAQSRPPRHPPRGGRPRPLHRRRAPGAPFSRVLCQLGTGPSPAAWTARAGGPEPRGRGSGASSRGPPRRAVRGSAAPRPCAPARAGGPPTHLEPWASGTF